ncbi:MAG: putative DNA base hypermodification protein [Polyangiaceae bacterium]
MPPHPEFRRIQVGGGRMLVVTPVFDSYWRFAAKRQEVFMRRVRGEAPPWTDDKIIAAHRFTNVYRASDRVSQYLIQRVIYEGDPSPEEVFFRTMLFKIFNKIETWERLQERVGSISWRTFDLAGYERALDDIFQGGDAIYSAAYIMPSPAFGEVRKHANHLRLIEHMLRDDAPRKVQRARSLEEVFRLLRAYPSFGDFLAFQLTIDLNYSEIIDFCENSFVVAGPGARDGIKKCFADTAGLSDAEVIAEVCKMADFEFERLELGFQPLGTRKLHLIDCQNIFCEVDKYARVAHPEYAGRTGRTKIKQRYTCNTAPLPQRYPPKWNVVLPYNSATVVPKKAKPRHSEQQSLFT